jgi:4-hydroxy-tetrahydrodipicolinate synthase
VDNLSNDHTPLKGIITAILTPLNSDLTIDHSRFILHALDLLARGGSRISTFGSTGEGVAFTPAEKREALDALIHAGIRSDQLLPAIMTSSLGIAATELSDLADRGCREILVLPPFYYPNPTIEGLLAFYEGLYDRARRPPVEFVLYNIPALTGVTITHDLVRRLQDGRGARIAGIKDSTGDLESGLSYLRAFPDLAVFTGDDRVLANLVRAGGAGMIGGLPNLYMEDLVAIYRHPNSPQADQLTAVQGERIAAIDGNGGLLALKSALADRLVDAMWRRAMPPLIGHS